MAKKEPEKRYELLVSENQLRIIRVALEEYFRLRMGQPSDFCIDMASINTDLSPDNPNHKRLFNRFLARRDHLEELMRCFFRIAFEPRGYLEAKTEDMLVAEDIWDAIRCAIGISRFEVPLHVSKEGLPEIREV